MLWFEYTIKSPQQFWRASLTNNFCSLAALLQQRFPKTGVSASLQILIDRQDPSLHSPGASLRSSWSGPKMLLKSIRHVHFRQPQDHSEWNIKGGFKDRRRGKQRKQISEGIHDMDAEGGERDKESGERMQKGIRMFCVVPLEGTGVKTHRDYFLCVPLMLFQQELSEAGPVSLFYRWCDWGSDLSDFFEFAQEQSWDSNLGFPAICCLHPPLNVPSLFPTLRFSLDPDLNPHKSQAVWHQAKPHKHPTFIVLMLWGAEIELWNSFSLLIKKRFRPTLGSQFYLTATAFNRCCIFIVANVTHRSIFPVMLLGFCSICRRENICRNLSASLQGLKLQL